MVTLTGPAVLWLLFGSWAVHDAEELLFGPGWLARHEVRLATLAARSATADRLVNVLERDRRVLAVAIGLIGLFVLAATVLGLSDPNGLGMLAYVTVLGGYALHVGIHLAQSVAVRGYAPGVATGVLVVLPACATLYGVLLASGYVSAAVATGTAVLGLAIVVPTALAAHRVGRAAVARLG